jgi:O-antigen/teichoic acid export membrane protein
MLAYLGWLVVFWALANLLVGRLGVVGLAVASTVAFTLLSAVLFYLNWRELDGLHGRELAVSGGRAVLATLGMVVVMVGIGRLSLSPLLFLAAAGAAGGLTYLILNHLLGGREIATLLRLLRG